MIGNTIYQPGIWFQLVMTPSSWILQYAAEIYTKQTMLSKDYDLFEIQKLSQTYVLITNRHVWHMF